MMGAHILWAIVSGILTGVYLRSFLSIGFSFVGFLVLLGFGSLTLLYLERGKRTMLISMSIGFLACAGGVMRMDAARLSVDPLLTDHVGKNSVLRGFVFEEPDVREGSVRISIRLESGTGVLVIAPSHTNVAYGDIVQAKGIVRLPESFETGLGREFNYPAYLAKDGIRYELAFVKQVEIVGRGTRNPIKAGAIWIKQKFLEGLGYALPEPAAGLAGGITVGDKRGLGSDLSNVFRTVGLIHIVVLSGYNIMIVMEGLSRALAWFRVARLISFASSIFVAVLFALMTGLASASVRAAAMAIIAVVGKMTGRMYLASRALALVALGMVLWNPWILAFDPGFQLSILATAGLIAFTPIIVTRLKFITPKLGLREIAATTIGTQIAVLPLLLYQSGQLSLVALPVNLLALIAVPWAMLFSAIAALGGLTVGPIAPIIGFPAYLLLSYILLAAEWAARLPFASVSVVAFSGWWLALVYLAYGVIFVLRKQGAAKAS